MSSTKAALKAAKAALDAQNYDKAIEEAEKVTGSDAKNYHANVFLGLALDKKERNDESEKAYRTAASAKPEEALAWQGLLSLYEKQGPKQVDAYGEAARRLAQVHADHEDRERCQGVVDKYVGFARQHGSRAQVRAALDATVPGSPLYGCLEGRVPPPDFTYGRIAELVEADEDETVRRLVAERRTRLGAKVGQVTLDVKREVYAASDLESLYQGIIDYSLDDDVRRLYEEKLLQRAYDVLCVLPAQDKEAKREQVRKLAEGMVIIKVPFELAWRIVLEWKDVESMQDWDVMLLRQYIELLPEDGLSKVLRGFLKSEISPFPEIKTKDEEGKEKKKDEKKGERKGEKKDDDNKEEEKDDEESLDPADRLYLMTEGLEESSRSVMSQRIMAEYYLYLEEYASAVEAARKALDLIAQERKTTGLSFQNRRDGIKTVLATSLVHHQTPRYHVEARGIFNDILARKPGSISALIGVGLILEEEENYEEAVNFLSQAQERSPTVKVKSEAAWCRAMTGNYAEALKDLEDCLEDIGTSDGQTRTLKAEVLYRIGYCMWQLDTSKAARKDRTKAYARFLQCLQLDLNFAPVYTSLGIFYADYARDKKRARKCFQKAFELSPSEVYAAQRLAKAFADISDWDLVETVAQRVVDSGKVRPPPGSKRKPISWPYAALGVCHLNNQEHGKAIPAFNAALRIDPQNYHCLVGLGESYHSSGRFIAATRVFEEAQKYEAGVDPADVWFARYMLGNVRRDLGDFEEAVDGFQAVLAQRPDEYGVSIALLQTYVESAWHDNALGLFGRAADTALEAVKVARKLATDWSESFNLWKSFGEALTLFASVGPYAKNLPFKEVIKILEEDADESTYEHLNDIDQVTVDRLDDKSDDDDSEGGTSPIRFALHAAILAQKRGITVSSKDIHAQAVSWYNLGWTEYRAHASLVDTAGDDMAVKKSVYLRAAVRCFKRAIELEARNAEFWNALGIVTTPLNARVAQHSFVRSLYLNDKSPQVWTNLATLYTMQNDIKLAKEAFIRAQSTDPAYAPAWVGQGILALLEGNLRAARGAFTQAFEIGDSSSIVSKELFSTSMFDHIVSQSASFDISDLLAPLFALYQLKTQEPDSLVSQHLLSLFAERIGNYFDSITALRQVAAAVEAEYEETESAESLAHFAQAQADLARACLAADDSDGAIEHATMALDLSEDESSGSLDPEMRTKYRLSAHLTAGLAHHRLGQHGSSIEMFRAALTESSGNPDVVCLLSQVLWAKGSGSERDVAREQLFDQIEKHPEHAQSIVLLSVIALLDGDKDTIEAVATDLHALRARTDLDEKQLLKISSLLEVFAKLDPNQVAGDPELAEQTEATTSIMLMPHKPHGWAQLSSVADATFPAEMALLTGNAAVLPNGSLGVEELSRVHAGTQQAAGAQRAIMLAPWMAPGWSELVETAKALA